MVLLPTKSGAVLWFWGQICHKNRPKLKKVGPEVTVPTDAQQDEDMDADPRLFEILMALWSHGPPKL